MHNRNLTLESRRTSRVSKLLPVRIRPRDASGNTEAFGAWTIVVNRHGARFESKKPFTSKGDIEVTVLATGRTAPGRVIWSNQRSNFRDNFEFAVELSDPANMWGITFPPEDWNEIENASPDRPQAVPVPLKSSNPKENKEIVTVLDSTNVSKSREGHAHPPESTAGVAPSSAATNFAPLPGSPENALTLSNNTLERAEPTVRLSSSAMTERLTGIVRELIESAVQIEEDVATNRLVGRMRDEFEQAKESAVISFEQKTLSLVSTEGTKLQEQAAEAEARTKTAMDESLRLIAEAKEQGTKSVRDEADASFSVIESLRNDVAEYVKTTEEQFIEVCRQRTEKVLTDSLETAQSKFAAKMEELAEKMAQRTEKILSDTVAAMEQRASTAIAEAASRLDSQRQDFDRNLDRMAEKVLSEIAEKQTAAAIEAQSSFKSATDASMSDLRSGLTKMLRGVADAVSVLENHA